jgi:chitinase
VRRSRLLTSTIAACAAAAAALLSVEFAGSAQAATLGSNWYGSAPYVMPLDNNPPDLAAVMAATGQKAFELAFILAPNGGGCTPTWDGTASVASDTTVASVINGVRSHGGDVTVSIGGYGGTKLGQACASVAATAAAYQQVIDKYALKAIDFDLEEPEYENLAAVNNELGAAQILQRNNAGLYVSITTAGTAAGTGYFGQNVLNTAKSLGFTPANYAIMPFDGGFNGAASQTAALEAFHTLLVNTFGWSSATAYNHEGVSMMNGRSDTGEYFYQSDFQTVLNYATGHGLTRYTFWSVNRDRACNPPSGSTSGVCSSVTQNDWDFTKYTTQFAGAAPPTTPPSVTPTSPGTCGAPAWNAATAYTGGQQVSYNGHTWTAKWWTQGDVPGNNSQNVWTDDGTCTGGGSSPTPGTGCAALSAWNSATVYVAGNAVSYAAHQWTAKWWTQGDTPGGSANVWTDNGPC